MTDEERQCYQTLDPGFKMAWFTFGQNHVHSISGFTFDKDVVVCITAQEPRRTAFDLFGDQWSMHYDDCPDLSLYPRGVKHLMDRHFEQKESKL